MSPNYAVVIPARYKSTRLPGKPLLKIRDKEMIVRTWERTVEAVNPERVWVATEDERIKEVAERAGAQVAMTGEACLTGTDRLYEFALQHADVDIVINVQGDEPIIDPDDIRTMVSRACADPDTILNGYARIADEAEWRSRAVPKVVFDQDKKMKYMSRAPIPGNKADTFMGGWKQICIYSFPVEKLRAFGEQGRKTPLEEIEDIEILRFAELGYDIQMVELSGRSLAVDTFDDVGKVEAFLKENGLP
ncbi:3-deoxy-manno-octulosonate cytidylyltransferase [Salibaculum griseiflavum]|uniref:3-deoxy-manno-octulosonate cytidylyltransferase n=1 Tax=Salibaculum griseiflavum TaxID=1914409 RepID=A0A2V1P2V1_9RHOB|nr:3-deoxy-manno-octulosonate cytidylyltransferase [Salibaculum griseiflavum]PWG16849.1 3-deoxy-manno-octulosonate cytidylyltransferase [Salibaculum griseiflavum]